MSDDATLVAPARDRLTRRLSFLDRKLRDRFFPGEEARLGGVRNCVGDFPAPPPGRRPA